MRLTIEFSPTRRRASARSLLLFVGALIALAAAAWTTFAVFEETQRFSLQLTASSLDRPRTRIALSPAKAEAINRAIRQLNLPWEELFSELEMRLDNRIALLGLEPDAANRILRLQGEAKSADDMLDFVRTLEESSFLHDASLVHHEINEGDRNRPVRFLAEARWRSD